MFFLNCNKVSDLFYAVFGQESATNSSLNFQTFLETVLADFKKYILCGIAMVTCDTLLKNTVVAAVVIFGTR